MNDADLVSSPSVASPLSNPDGAPEDAGASGSTNSALFGRSIWYVAATAVQLVAATVVSPVLAYTLGPEEFGRQALTIAVYQVLILFAQVGMDQAIWVRRAQSNDARSTRELLAAGCAIAFVIGLVMLATMRLWGDGLGYHGAQALLLATIVLTPAGAATVMVLSVLLAIDNLAGYVTVVAIFSVLGQIVGLTLVFAVGHTATVYIWGVVACQYLALAVGLAISRPAASGIFKWRSTWSGLTVGLPIMASQMAVYVLNSSDRIVVQRDLGAKQTGRYQVAYTIGALLLLILGYLNQSWGPRFLAVADRARRSLLLARSRDQLYRLLVPATLGVTLAAPLALRLLAPSSFEPHSLVLIVYLIVISAVPFTAAGATRRSLIALGRLRALAIAAGTAAALNVALNIVLVPPLEILGSALATLVAFSAQAMMQRRMLRDDPLAPTPTPILVQLGIASSAAGLTILLPQDPAWNWARFGVALVLLGWLLARLRATRLGDPLRSDTGPAPRHRRVTSRQAHPASMVTTVSSIDDVEDVGR